MLRSHLEIIRKCKMEINDFRVEFPLKLCFRQQALMRIGSDVEKQQQYEKKLYDTIDAKRKINQVRK